MAAVYAKIAMMLAAMPPALMLYAGAPLRDAAIVNDNIPIRALYQHTAGTAYNSAICQQRVIARCYSVDIDATRGALLC